MTVGRVRMGDGVACCVSPRYQVGGVGADRQRAVPDEF